MLRTTLNIDMGYWFLEGIKWLMVYNVIAASLKILIPKLDLLHYNGTKLQT